jgi:cell division septation protein DedD
MRSVLEEEEKEASEITLSTASLLGIFFGLVLVCGVFFGFGYSMGRGSGASSAPAASVAETDPTPVEKLRPAPAAEPEDKPVVNDAVDTAAPAVVVKQEEPAAAQTPSLEARAEEAPAAPVAVKAALHKPSAVPEPAGLGTTSDIAAAPAGKPMVQIAAVARQEDADALVSALKQRGYGVVIRSEAQDKLLHVQVGPFADRTQAAAMKQKLMSDGYNAIIKQ